MFIAYTGVNVDHIAAVYIAVELISITVPLPWLLDMFTIYFTENVLVCLEII